MTCKHEPKTRCEHCRIELTSCTRCDRYDLPVSAIGNFANTPVPHVAPDGKPCTVIRCVFSVENSRKRQQENMQHDSRWSLPPIITEHARLIPRSVSLVPGTNGVSVGYQVTLEESTEHPLAQLARMATPAPRLSRVPAPVRNCMPLSSWGDSVLARVRPLVTYKRTAFDIASPSLADQPQGIRYACGRRAFCLIDHDDGDAQ